jgi:hypothetical protein
MIEWEAWQRAVKEDGGSVWDVYVLDTDRQDWQRLLDFLRGTGLPLSFQRGEITEPLPQDVAHAFWGLYGPCEDTTMLSILLDEMLIKTHFVVDYEVELDIGPREVQSEADLDRLLGFLAAVAQALGKTVLVSSEGFHQYPWLTIEASGVRHWYGD